MARPSRPSGFNGGLSTEVMQGEPGLAASLASSTSVYHPGKAVPPKVDRNSIAKQWQIEAYRQVNICGEARYAATLFANTASKAELGISEPQTLQGKPVWITSGPEVDALAELAPTVRDRTKLIRDYMLHRVIAGEAYLISRKRVETDPPTNDDNLPIWEIVSVTEIQKVGVTWRVRHDNGNYLDLEPTDPVIRMWNPDPMNRREAWSPFRSLLGTLREIEWLTLHIFTQVRSRLMSSKVWFLPNNLTFPRPPEDSVEGGAEAIAIMNEAEQFMLSLAASATQLLDENEVSFPTIVMADPAALADIDQKKLIEFWSQIDDKAMLLREDAIRRFALGMDLPPEQVLGTAGLSASGTQSSGGGARGVSNHWGKWADREQMIQAQIEPALDDFTGALTASYLRTAVDGTTKVVAYDTSTLRVPQDKSTNAMQWYDRGLLKGDVALRETGFDPTHDKMDDAEHRLWLLDRLAGGSATPEQVQAALALLGVPLPAPTGGFGGSSGEGTPVLPDRNLPPSLKDMPKPPGKPTEDHFHKPAPYSNEGSAAEWNPRTASCEVLVLRALEKAGNRLLNDGRRGRDKDRTTPAHLAHIAVKSEKVTHEDFDFSLAGPVFSGLSAQKRAQMTGALGAYCVELYDSREPYTREALMDVLEKVNVDG